MITGKFADTPGNDAREFDLTTARHCLVFCGNEKGQGDVLLLNVNGTLVKIDGKLEGSPHQGGGALAYVTVGGDDSEAHPEEIKP